MATPLYVNTAFENGSPLDWDVLDDGTLELRPQFDYEHGPAMNRQLTHWHFRVHGTKGQTLRLRMAPRENIYGGRRVNAFAKRIGNQMSVDAVNWTPFVFEQKEDKSIEATVTLPADVVYIGRIEPYTTKHLGELLARLRGHRHARVDSIGKTVEGRDLELITLSSGAGKPMVFFRGRAHPWEAGGNWFLDGVVEGALASSAVLDACDIGILPMAGKDGVVRGQTRFNVNGHDLNRGFTKDYDFGPHNAPENQALMEWLKARQRQGALPLLAIDLHDDDWGNLHVGRMGVDEGYDRRIALLDQLMRKHTYYTEGMAKGAGSSTFGDGLREIFGMDSVVYELNSNWLAAANCVPGSAIWREFGAQFARMLVEYVPAVKAG
ncbi:MAG: hypothetical protein A3K19_15340 [Lentisphaerae bacterium RIFOXYB12_FULL_65_16]|nr:MAG: hypothetical protein A3K18_29185 [Lentisphaerae bacterium RIFOXYA12_64_32]OGV88473.1 MAG: hypothetical protein A3K19_15340 [Lentisphaerae bacterium RIFOXYB12_FULL_65_16]